MLHSALAPAGGQMLEQQHLSDLPLPPSAEASSSLAWGTCQQDVLTVLPFGAMKHTMGWGMTISHLGKTLTPHDITTQTEINDPT